MTPSGAAARPLFQGATMIVIEKLFLAGLAYQWVLAKALRDLVTDLIVSDGPGSLSFPDKDTGLVFDVYGSELGFEPDGPFNGTASRVKITSPGAPGKFVDITLPTATLLDDLVTTARDVPPWGNINDLADFNRVLMPADSPFPDLQYTGGDEDNVVIGFYNDDFIDLGGGADLFHLGLGKDRIDGGPGKDMVSAEFFDAPVDIDLHRKTISSDGVDATLKSVENANGSTYDDTITGNKKSNQLFGDEGDDTLNGGGGNDKLYGGPGDDTLKGGGGRDRIEGGDGNDTIHGQGGPNTLVGGAGKDSIYAGNKGDKVEGGGGSDLIVGGFGNDALSGGSGRDEIVGGAGDDIVDGGGGNDKLNGGRGADTITGGTGKDRINGGAGDDTLEGGPGNDRLEGGEDNDTLFGGPGRDTLIFRSVTKGRTEGDDAVVGFEAGKDTIAIVGGAPGDLSVTTSGGDTIIDYGNGTITIQDQTLTQDQITFEFGL